MSPKPILKRSATEQVQKTDLYAHPNRTVAVHFPPSPATRTFSVDSAAAYDRSPIVVTPNNCALPERGCPGRTYTLEDSPPRRGISYARDFHPRALAFASSRSSIPVNATADQRLSVSPPLPRLIPDLSSESDESDGYVAPPSLSTTSYPAFGIHGLAGPLLKYDSDPYSEAELNRYVDDSNALAFLPHPPSPPCPKHQYTETIDPFPQNYRRRRGERDSKHESSRDPDRIPSSGRSPLASPSLSISSSLPSSSPPKKRNSPKRSQQPRQCLTPMSLGFGNLDDGCLGGF
jgi:hypothetical protein